MAEAALKHVSGQSIRPISDKYRLSKVEAVKSATCDVSDSELRGHLLSASRRMSRQAEFRKDPDIRKNRVSSESFFERIAESAALARITNMFEYSDGKKRLLAEAAEDLVDFSMMDFSGRKITHRPDLQGHSAPIKWGNFRSSDFTGAVIEGMSFMNSSFDGAVFKDAEILNSTIAECSAKAAMFESTGIQESVLRLVDFGFANTDLLRMRKNTISEIMFGDFPVTSSSHGAGASRIKLRSSIAATYFLSEVLMNSGLYSVRFNGYTLATYEQKIILEDMRSRSSCPQIADLEYLITREDMQRSKNPVFILARERRG